MANWHGANSTPYVASLTASVVVDGFEAWTVNQPFLYDAKTRSVIDIDRSVLSIDGLVTGRCLCLLGADQKP